MTAAIADTAEAMELIAVQMLSIGFLLSDYNYYNNKLVKVFKHDTPAGGQVAGLVWHPYPVSGPIGERSAHASEPLRMAQLPAACPSRSALLQGPQSRARAEARLGLSSWLWCKASGREGQVVPVPGPGACRAVQQMRQTDTTWRGVGPGAHRRPAGLDRSRTRALQSQRWSGQQRAHARALDLNQ